MPGTRVHLLSQRVASAQNHLKLQEHPAFQESEEFRGSVGRCFGQTGPPLSSFCQALYVFLNAANGEAQAVALGWDGLCRVGPDDQEASGFTENQHGANLLRSMVPISFGGSDTHLAGLSNSALDGWVVILRLWRHRL